ncbi:hypothetical protein ALC56_09109, partial [Trachymyrmex septentrionalis]
LVASLGGTHTKLQPDRSICLCQWIRACGRLGLEPKGPEYAYQNCRLCHLHFEEKLYKINKMRVRLHPDAIPTIFFVSKCGKENTIDMDKKYCQHLDEDEDQVETNNYKESAEILPIIVDNVDAEIVKLSTSKNTKQNMKSSEDSPRKKKLRLKLAKLKAQNKTLRKTIRRLRLKEKKKSIQVKETNKQETLKKLGRKLLPQSFNKILAAQIDAQCKNKRGRRYDRDFKKFTLSLYFLSPRNVYIFDTPHLLKAIARGLNGLVRVKFDQMVLNSSNVNNPKEYGKVFIGSDKQMQFLQNMLNFLKSIKVIIDNNKYVKLKCFNCWQITIKSTIQLWTILKNYNLLYLRTRRLNQDSVENFFAFKKLFCTKLFQYSKTQNCANDNDDLLNIIGTSNITETSTISKLVPSCLAIHLCAAYQNFVNDNKVVLDNTTLYCSFRAYENENRDLFGNLKLPTNDFCYYIHKLEEIFVKNFEKNCDKKNIGNYLFQLTQNLAFEPPCPDFPKDFLIKLFLWMCIYYTLSQHNKLCKTIT